MKTAIMIFDFAKMISSIALLGAAAFYGKALLTLIL